MFLIKKIKSFRNYLLVKIIWRKYNIAKGFHAGARVRLWAKEKLTIGSNFYIGRDSLIETDCVIGSDVIIGNKVGIIGKYDHNFQQIGVPIRRASQIRDKDYNWKGSRLLTIIGDDVWIGYGATIIGGVTINNGAIIAAGSVVTRNVEEYSIYAGNPAKKIGDRFNSEEEKELHKKQIVFIL
jgi:acetyltransferase-like isoleucine patch superfamily enzyme